MEIKKPPPPVFYCTYCILPSSFETIGETWVTYCLLVLGIDSSFPLPAAAAAAGIRPIVQHGML